MDDAFEQSKKDNPNLDHTSVGKRIVWLATRAVYEDSVTCEEGCGVIGLSKQGKIERLKSRDDWFLADILPD